MIARFLHHQSAEVVISAILFPYCAYFETAKEGNDMSDHCCSLSVGEKVPDFELEMFDPIKNDFGKISLKKLKAAKKWTVLFYYPADFTFV